MRYQQGADLKGQPKDETSTSQMGAAKAEYTKPTLTEYGHVDEIIRGGTDAAIDALGGSV